MNPLYRSFRRWLYAGKRPNWIAKIANRVAVGMSGGANNDLITLEVAGRKTGRTVSLPLVMATIDGQRYLVSMLGDHVQWVLNVRAAEGKAAIRGEKYEQVRLVEVPVADRAPIIKAYLARATGARPHMPVDENSSIEEIEKVAAQYPTFHVEAR